MKKVALSFVAVAALTAGVAQAAPKTEGAYVFGNYTHANLKSDSMEADTKKQSKSAFGLGGGYRFSENFALEAGFKNLGKEKSNSDKETETTEYHEQADSKGNAFVVRAIGILPVSDELSFEGFVGAGLATVKVDDTYERHGSYYDESGNVEYKKTSLIPTIGVGATYAINSELSVFTRYEHMALPKIGNVKFKSNSIDLGIRYNF